MRTRYDLRRDLAGWTVFDVWTGQTVVIADYLQCGLGRSDALALMDLLNDQARHGNRVVLQ